MIEAIVLPKPPPRSGDAYLRFIPRTEMDIAVVSAGVNLTLDAKGVIKSARVALGAVAPESAIREVVLAAGFTGFRRATETPFNRIFEARK